MGLDITAHANAQVLPDQDWAEEDYDREDLVHSIYMRDFMHAVEGLDLPETGDSGVWHVAFKVDPTPWGQRTYASLGYIGYTLFRNRLAALSHREDSDELQPGEPFWEMCWMSDCEGVFSTAACKRIAADFDKHRDAFVTDDENERWLVAYDRWAAVFRHAAENDGIVEYR